MKKGERPRIFQDGEQTRDQVYIKDVVRANILALESGKRGIVNVGSGEAISFNQIVRELNDILGTSLEPEYFENRFPDRIQKATQADLTLAKKLIGYEPEWPFERAVRDYIKL